MIVFNDKIGYGWKRKHSKKEDQCYFDQFFDNFTSKISNQLGNKDTVSLIKNYTA